LTPPRLLLLLLAGLFGCATTIPNELLSARRAYAEAAAGPAATLVPADLHRAKTAMSDAEAAFADDPKGFHTRDLAYVAQRKSELAQALAASAAEDAQAATANAQYQTTQDAIMLDTKAKLGASQSDLASSQNTVARTQAELTASESARAAADAQAKSAMAALAKLAAVKEEARGLVITLSGSVLFASDQAALLPSAQARLGDVASALLATKERPLIVEGHTDSQGADAYNLDLSQRRAESVRQFLISQGYDGGKIRAVGIGEARPVADNATAEGRANNRRVEIIVSPPVASTH
jgi:outer membrane protein OmpA-like peptidoglycan-associated protein